MFEQYLNKRVKIVVKDGDSFKSLRGTFMGIESNSDVQFITLDMTNGWQSFKLRNIEKIRLELDEGDTNEGEIFDNP